MKSKNISRRDLLKRLTGIWSVLLFGIFGTPKARSQSLCRDNRGNILNKQSKWKIIKQQAPGHYVVQTDKGAFLVNQNGLNLLRSAQSSGKGLLQGALDLQEANPSVAKDILFHDCMLFEKRVGDLLTLYRQNLIISPATNQL